MTDKYRSYLPSAERPPEIEMIRDLVRSTNYGANKAVNNWTDPKDAFVMKTANTWMAEMQRGEGMKKLFGTFWFENELCILFADTNVGKSILAVQIAESIASGKPIYPFAQSPVVAPVMYFDFELSSRQFEQRYTINGQQRHPFSEQFYRVVPNPNATGSSRFKNHAEYLIHSLENKLITSKVKIIIIDNLNCLCPGTDGAGVALKLMQQLQLLKAKYQLSVLVLAHTPKRNPTRPITRNDLQGSKMLINFCDSAFALGESQARRTRQGVAFPDCQIRKFSMF
jgi:RecA-family ATPase